MNEIFESEEFLKFEKLCNVKKVSFVVSLTKFSSVNKPKKGPVYAMSDFFVYDIPEDWERLAIRATPHSTWLNPKELPPLSHPLSKLLTMPVEIKQNFIEMWNHIHGVMTESYFCPKLYLTRIPRAEVEKYMDSSLLPPGSHLSCCDLVYFPVFVAWLKSPAAEDKVNGHTRIRFVGLLIHLAYQLYQLNPETHVQGKASATNDLHTSANGVEVTAKAVEKEEEILILTPSKPQPKTPDKSIPMEEDIEILTPEKPLPDMACSSTQTPPPNKQRKTPDQRPPMVSIASDIVQALEEIEILTPKKQNGTQSPNDTNPPARCLSATRSHDSNSLDEITEIEIMTPSKIAGTEPKTIDCIDLELIDDEESNAKEVLVNPTKDPPIELNSMVFTKSSASGQTSEVQSCSKVKEGIETKPKSTLQLRKDLWGKPTEVVDITDDLSDESVSDTPESDVGCSRTNPVKLKSREELKSMLWGKDVDSSHKDIKDSDNASSSKDDNNTSKNESDKVKVEVNKASENNPDDEVNKESDGKNEEKLHRESSNTSGDVSFSKTSSGIKGEVVKPEEKTSSGIKEEVVKPEEKFKNEVGNSNSQSKVSDVKKNMVSDSLGKLIQICIKLLPKKEFTLFSRKVSKYLNNLAEEHTSSVELVKFIDNKCSVIKSDKKNKYVHMKEVFDEMKKFRQSEVGETSETSINDPQKKPVIETVSNLDDKENIPQKQNDHIPPEILMEVDPPIEYPDEKDTCQNKPSDEVSTDKETKNVCSIEVLEPSSEELTKNLSLKEVLQSFLEMCRKSLAAKVFQPYFKQILKFMNNLDPAHLNSLPLKVFVHEHSQQKNKSQTTKQQKNKNQDDVISHIEAVIEEILKYQKSFKRALPSDEVTSQAPPKKKVCLTTIATKVPSKKSTEPVLKDTSKSSSTEVEAKKKSVDNCVNLDSIDTDINASNVTAASVDMESTPIASVPDTQESSPSDIFQSLGLRPNNGPDKSKVSLDKEKEAKSSTSEEEKAKSSDTEMEVEKPSSSKLCFNENLVHEKDKKKQKKKVSPQHLEKLEKALKKCAKEIKKLEEAEVDWDDDGDSNYILCAKYKRRYMDLFNKIANYKELSNNLDRKSEKKFFCTESRYPEINKKIQKFINRTKEFPDFQDIKKLVKEANSTLHLSALQANDEAENIFQSVGKKLKKRREIDDTNNMVSYLKEDQMEDPAAKNEELDKILIVQAVEGKKNLNKYLDDFYRNHVINAKSGDEVENSESKKVEVSKLDENPSTSEDKDKKEASLQVLTNANTLEKEENKSSEEKSSGSEAALAVASETSPVAVEKLDVQLNSENKSDNDKSAEEDPKEKESGLKTGIPGGELASCDTTSTSNVETEVDSNQREVDNSKDENEVKGAEDDSTAKKT